MFRAIAVVSVIWALAGVAAAQDAVKVWVSSYDMKDTLTQKEDIALEKGRGKAAIVIDAKDVRQSILGFGSSFEHATCSNLFKLTEAQREEVIERIVSPDKGIGMNLMRVCIGTSDFVAEPWYSLDDMPEGESDPNLEHFSIEKDKAHVLPVLKSALAKNPDLLFFASPWSAPGWMKDSGQMCGGKLKPACYDVYAQYLLKFVQAYEAEGIPIYAMTLQNEPGVNQKTYPSCFWNGEMQRDFIKSSFGPALKASGLTPLIWCFDHNFNNLPFPRAVLSDPQAAQYVDGTGFHHYGGKPLAMTTLATEFPDKHVYFTEGSTFRLAGAYTIMQIFGNGARSYNAWVTMIDDQGKPNNGPHDCSPTCILLNTKTLQPEFRFDYYMYGHFSKFIERGARCISGPPESPQFAHIAFLNPNGEIVVIVINGTGEEKSFKVRCRDKAFEASLAARSMATYVAPKID